ncbi:MAG: tRNA pseudouridine(38-40) synthase TruA [Fidelibacterota bacterium]
MRRFQFKVEYDGVNYAGWQVQNNAPTVQGMIEKALRDFNNGQLIRIHGAGRTDAGVHALGQVAHFDLNTKLDALSFERAINAKTPIDIHVYDCREVNPNRHSRHSARRRTYIYKISTKYSPLLRNNHWWVRWDLDYDKLQQCAKLIEGEHDFESFCRTADQAASKVCFIYNSVWKKEDNLLTYTIAGTRFLHSMVRMLVGTMVEVGRGKHSVEKFKQMLSTTTIDPTRLTAPAHGLYLAKVEYQEDME